MHRFDGMNSIEVFLIDLGLSWTASKLVPYVFFGILGLVLSFLFRKKLRSSRKVIKLMGHFILLILPFACYFAWSPIYEGDFSNTFRTAQVEKIQQEREGKQFVVIAIPFCKYCKGAMTRIEKMVEREPNLKVEVVVCTQDSTKLNWYRSFLSNKISITQVKYPILYRRLVGNQFPTFALVEKEQIKVWSYDNFGVRAMDFIEAEF